MDAVALDRRLPVLAILFARARARRAATGGGALCRRRLIPNGRSDRFASIAVRRAPSISATAPPPPNSDIVLPRPASRWGLAAGISALLGLPPEARLEAAGAAPAALLAPYAAGR